MVSKKLLFALALVVSSFLSFGMINVFAEDELVTAEAYGTVEALTPAGSEVTDDKTAKTVVTYGEGATLQWSAANSEVGRNKDGWWIGIKINAPEELNAEQLKEVKYQTKTADGRSQDKSFWANKDSKDTDASHYIGCWGLINEEYLNDFITAEKDMTYAWQFDWNNDGTFGQEIKLVISPNGITLMKEDEKVYPHVSGELTTDIGEKEFKVGKAVEFTFTTKANDYAGVMVIGTSNFSDSEAIEKLEYYEVNDGKWYELTGDFGPSTGFPMSDATSKFRVTFKKAGDYTFTASMKKVEDGSVLCDTEVEFTVVEKTASELTTDIGEKEFKVGKAVEFTFTTKANDYAGVMVIGTSNFSDSEAIEKLEYYEVNDGKWYELTGDFGPSTGFPMSDATSKFRVTFKKAGDYTFTASMKKVEDGSVLCDVEVAFTVEKVTSSGGSGGGSSTTRYTITVTEGDNGSISPNGNVRVKRGNDQSFTIKAENGYKIADVIVDGKSVGVVSKYVFEDVKEKHSIEAKFEKAEEAKTRFKDVNDNDWFYDAVQYVVDHNIMEGVKTDEFEPNTNMTRAMAVMVLYNVENRPEVKEQSSFNDVDSNEWYASAISWAEANKIVNGVGNNEFRPDEAVTREQLSAMFYRYAAFKGENTKVSNSYQLSFNDATSVSNWAYTAMCWNVKSELIEGKDGNLLAPLDSATRAEFATIIMRYLESK